MLPSQTKLTMILTWTSCLLAQPFLVHLYVSEGVTWT